MLTAFLHNRTLSPAKRQNPSRFTCVRTLSLSFSVSLVFFSVWSFFVLCHIYNGIWATGWSRSVLVTKMTLQCTNSLSIAFIQSCRYFCYCVRWACVYFQALYLVVKHLARIATKQESSNHTKESNLDLHHLFVRGAKKRFIHRYHRDAKEEATGDKQHTIDAYVRARAHVGSFASLSHIQE